MALDLDDVETTHEQILQFALIGAAAELERVHEYWTAATERWERERKMLAESLERVKGECDELRAERDALKSAASGWFRVGDWAFVTLDGRIVRNTNGEWAAEDADHLCYGSTAIEAARDAGWHDFPGASDHSAGDP